MGLLDFMNSPTGQGLLSAVAAGAAGARKGTPWNNFGRGALGGLAGYADAQNQLQQQEENAFQRQFRQMQMDQLQTEAARRKAMQEAGMVAAERSMTPQFEVAGKTFQNLDDANMEAAPQTVYAGTMPQSPLISELGAPEAPLTDYSGASPFNMTPQPMQRPAQQVSEQGVFNPAAYSRNMMQELAQRGFAEDAMKYAPKKDDVQLVTVYDEQGTPTQKWLRPGEADGVSVGRGKPGAGSQSSIGQMIAEMNKLPPSDPMRRYYESAIKKATTHAPAVQVTNNAPGPKYREGVDKLGAELLFNQYGEANNAATAINAVRDATTLLDKGMFTGKFGPAQEAIASWYQGATGTPMPKLDATQQFKTVIGDIVLPALSSLKGASSDRDFIKLEEYSRGEVEMTEQALRNHLRRLENKYGSQISNFNRTFDDYTEMGGAMIPGVRRLEMPSGNIKADKQGGMMYDDPEKERRYQEWKRSQGQ